jgi:small-conductance mechanosensitive channel
MEVPLVPELWEAYGPLLVTALALTLGFLAVGIAYRVLHRMGRRVRRVALVAQRTHKPAQVLIAILVARFAVLATTDTGDWRDPLLHAMLVGVIAAAGWLVASLLLIAFDGAKTRYGLANTETWSELHTRRAHTQLVVLRRVTIAGVAVITLGAVLYTFPSVRGIGTSVLASAGLIGVVAGLAAQSTLGNLIAGMQLAFGDRLRIGDVVVVEGEWGTVDELTLGYVVIRIWDQRRLILPTSYFTTTPFTHWTRHDARILGTVELDLDWTVPVPEMRAELERFAAEHPLWDGRAATLQVTSATGAVVQVRALVSAANGSVAWDLRCDVREHLVEWVRRHYPHALPRTRTEVSGIGAGGATGTAGVPAQPERPPDEAGAARP